MVLTPTKLTRILEETNITAYTINAAQQTLDIDYKEEFDALMVAWGIKEARQLTGSKLPYGADHYASFHHKGWRVSGNILRRKPNEQTQSSD